jgi:hypothetical protein
LRTDPRGRSDGDVSRVDAPRRAALARAILVAFGEDLAYVIGPLGHMDARS